MVWPASVTRRAGRIAIARGTPIAERSSGVTDNGARRRCYHPYKGMIAIHDHVDIGDERRAHAPQASAWGDFFLCALLGWCGAHKFRESRPGMGVLYLLTGGLFFVGWLSDAGRYYRIAVGQPDPAPVRGHASSPTPSSALGGERRLLPVDPLPVVPTNVLLSPGELCHLCCPATYHEIRNEIVRQTGRISGGAGLVGDGLAYELGRSVDLRPVREDVAIPSPGTLSVTDRRIVFSGVRCAFDEQVTALSSITPIERGLALQFGSRQHILTLDEARYALDVIERVLSGPVPDVPAQTGAVRPLEAARDRERRGQRP